MARRKLNTKVVGVLVGIVAVGSISVLAANKLFKPSKDPRVLEEQGDKAFAAGDFEQARGAFGGAAAIERGNANLRIKEGDTLIKLTRDDPANYVAAMRAWEMALGIDPNFKPALERILASRWEQVELGGGAEVFADIRRRAEQLAKADPAHPKARLWQSVATLRQALSGQAIHGDEVEKAQRDLSEFASAHPTDAEAPFYLAMMKLKEASDQIAGRSQRDADAACDAAVKIIESALAGQSTNAQMQHRAASVYRELARLDRRAADRKYAERAAECVLAAQQYVKDGDPNIDDIILQGADHLAREGKEDEARALIRKRFEMNQDNQRMRLAWARMLASKKATRDQAVKLLSREVPLPKDAVGVGVFRHLDQQAVTFYELIRLRKAELASEVDPAKRKEILAQIDTDMDRLRRLASARAPKVLALEGELLMLKGQMVEAVKVMEEAYAGMTAGVKDWETVYNLARAYDSVRQPGRARRLCEEVVSLGGGSNYVLPARTLLADLLLRENRPDEAFEHITIIEKSWKDYTGLERLQLNYLIAKGKVKEVYERLPETKNPERWNKIRYAQLMNNSNEQLRLLTQIVAAEPGDVEAVRALATVYRGMKLPDRARQVVDAGLKAKPDDASLKLFKAELDGTSANELRDLARDEIEKKVKDPYEKAIRLYELYRMANSPDEAMACLKQALTLRPDDSRALDLAFKESLERRQFAEARKYLDSLTRLNADQVGGRLYRHRLAMAEQNVVEAETIGLDLVTRFAEFAQSWLALGESQEALGKWPDAIRSYTEVLARQPLHYEAARSLVDCYYNAGRTDDARSRLREMRTNFPNDQIVKELYLNHLANFGEPQLAIADREEQLKKDESNPWPYLALASTHFKNAQRLSAENKLDDSVKEIDKAFNTLLAGQKRFPEDTRFYAQVAEIRQYNGQMEIAEQVLKDFARRENMKQAPAKIRPDPWIALADFYVRAGRLDHAIESLNEALVRSENNLDIRLRLASTQLQARKFADAGNTLDAVRNSLDPRVGRQRLELLVAQGHRTEAEAEIRKALQLRDGTDLRNLLASILIDTDRPDLAIVELNRALTLDSKNEASRYLRALALAKKAPPDINGAINELVDLKRSAPNQMQARLLLAELYERTGKRGNAIQDLAEGVKLAPGNRDVRLALVRLYRAERPPKFQEAFELLSAAGKDPVLKMDPIWPREAAVLFMQQRNFQQAVIFMTRAVQLSPGNVDYRRELVDLQLQFNDLAGAEIQIDKLLQDGVDGWWLRRQRGLAIGRQVTRSMLNQVKSDPTVAARVEQLRTAAIAEFDRALNMAEPQADPELFSSIVRTMGETVGNDVALIRVGPKTANDPDNRWRLLQIGLKRGNNDFDGAIADAQKMLADPSNAKDPERRGPLLRALADTYQSKPTPDFTRAIAYYEELLTLVPNDLVSLNNVAFVLAELITPPDPQKARIYSQRAYETTQAGNNPNPLILDTHGWVLVLCGGADGTRGRLMLQGVVETNPLFVEGRYHLGEAYLRVQPIAPAQAEKELNECIRLMNEDDKIGQKVDEKLRARVQAALASAREKLRNP